MSLHLVPKTLVIAAWSIVVLAGLAAGWIGAEHRKAESLRRVRDDVRRSAVAFNADELAALTGDLTDLGRPGYAAIHQRLRDLQNIDPEAVTVYILRANSQGAAIVLAHSKGPADPRGAKSADGSSAAARVAPSAILPGPAWTRGPVSTPSGEWVTGYARIGPALPGTLGGDILAIDFDASHWTSELALAALQTALYPLIIFGLPLLAWIVTRRQGEQNEVIRNLSEAMEQSRSALLIVDLDRRIEYANRGLCQQTGYRRRELLGREWRDFVAPGALDDTLAEIVATVRSGQPWEGEWLSPRKDGSHYPARGVITPVKHRDGSLACFVAVFDDVTESKRREAELREARDLAEAGDRAKSQFLATMSHEVRTPLNGIVGFTNLLLETPLASEQREYVQTIRTSGEALIQLTGDILDFARIESGKFKLDAGPCDPRECVEDALDMLATKAAAKKIELLHRVADDVPAAIIIDGGRLRQVIVNLVGNAVKFTPAGEVEVKVRLAANGDFPPPAGALGSDQCVLEFSIRDTGIGIAPEDQGKLFKPFSQVDETSTRRFGGTGLGLAICRNLVGLLGGEISCVSAPDQGATFTFTVRAPVAILAPPRRGPGRLRIGVAAEPGPWRRELAELAAGWGNTVIESDTIDGLAGQAWDIALVDAPEALAQKLADNPEPLPGLPPAQTFGLVPISLPTALRVKLRTHFRLLINKPVRHESLYAFLSGGGPAAGLPPPARADFDLRVLVAEDNLVNQLLMQRVLHSLGCTSAIVANGREALDELTRSPTAYDVLLLDMHMPEMDGLTALRAIRAGSAGAEARAIWIIALTADAREAHRAQALAAGVNDYLTKPLDLAQLEAALSRRRAGGTPADS